MYAEGILIAPQFVAATRATTARRMPNQPMDEAKFEAFYRKTAGKIESYIYRMTGDVDYLLQAVIPDVAAYDRLYKRLIGKITLADVSSSFVMEEIKSTTVLPLDYAPAKRG